MAVVIETQIWEPNPSLYLFLFISSFLSIFLFPYFSSNNNNNNSPVFPDLGIVSTSSQSSFLRFQRLFLLIYSLASVNEGIQSVFGEFEFEYYGVNREEMVMVLCVGSVAALLFGTFLGMLSDVIGPKKICVTFCFLHLVASIWKIVTMHPGSWITSIFLALASSVYSFSFESWMVTEHEKLGHRQDLLSETFWLMVFFESASLIGSQVLGNLLIGANAENGIWFPSIAVVLLSITIGIYITREWKEIPLKGGVKDYMIALNACVLHDKKILLLGCAQACLHFATTILWILWAPTIVADGREVHLGLIYPCMMGARMLGSTTVPWFHSGFFQIGIEDCLMFAFSIAGLVLSIIAYDYQEIEVLVTLFCFFHVCVGIILASLARLRSIYVPNELRGGMISLSLAPANAAILFVLIQRGYFRSIENSTVMSFGALGLFLAAGCLYVLKKWGKLPRQNWHEL
ncbi:hypothetical protein ACHQM5_024994 [Ranunculus cassubicifolius]